ncbi:MAG: S41 family peptidase, partial [Planctomycetota bacterium]
MFSNVLTKKITTPLMVLSKILLLSSAIITLSGCKSGLSIKGDDTEKFLPSQQLADCRTFGRIVTSVHPNLNFYDSELSFEKALANCSKRLNKNLSLRQFYRTISPVADVLKDDHTMIYSPQGSSISQQRRYADEIYSDIKSKKTVGSNSYTISEQRRLCVLKFNTCGMPWEHHLYKAFFERLFRDINEHKVDTLIIDIRRNQGGYSSNASELLRYIADAPFRQYEKAERRI